MHIYSFEKLQVWKDARLLVKWIYKTSSFFPADEKFGLVMQLRRAAVSVVSNLAEGSSRTSFKDQAHFSQIAYSSLTEILNQLIIANDLGFLSDEMLTEGRNQIETVTAKVAALRNAQLAKATKP
ncbi:four helix bundle protein [Terrimonas alba]|uniref:four helix bundle protein n=1 Tax=Terrimonas alba TaxID=3349636 RepID=UPI0035F37101